MELSQSSILFLIKAPNMIEADGDMQRFAQPCPDVCSFIAVFEGKYFGLMDLSFTLYEL